jgi:Integrase core domain
MGGIGASTVPHPLGPPGASIREGLQGANGHVAPRIQLRRRDGPSTTRLEPFPLVMASFTGEERPPPAPWQVHGLGGVHPVSPGVFAFPIPAMAVAPPARVVWTRRPIAREDVREFEVIGQRHLIGFRERVADERVVRIMWGLISREGVTLSSGAVHITCMSKGWRSGQVVDAFPWDEAPRYLLRDRDRIYGDVFRQRVRTMGIEEMLIASRSPWQNPYSERLIWSIRRECLDHRVALHERHLRRLLTDYFHYSHRWRTHRALGMDCPLPRPVQRPADGLIREAPEVGGLHHHYERRAAL